ncbi:transcriptional regulator [Paenibacillaceae bacterium]|nr:transcriptional regulator [Paenibacillaceae bacterium]
MSNTELYCQSCSMPLPSEELLGTEQTGAHSTDYCIYCYVDGQFTQPELTVEEMIEACIPHMADSGMDEQQVRELLTRQLPLLKRWQSSRSAEQAALLQPQRIVEHEEIRLAGLGATTTNADELTENARIPQLWEHFWKNQDAQHLYHAGEPQVIYGSYSDYETDASGAYRIQIGCRVQPDAELPQSLTEVILPASKYAVFTSRRGPFPAVVIELWQAIWQWERESGSTRTFTGDFELYDERSANPEDAQIDIYIAIQ